MAIIFPLAIIFAALAVIFTVFLRGVCGDDMIVAPGVSVEFTCTGPADEFQPTWFVNGRVAETDGDCYRSALRTAGESNYTTTLTINGNRTCDTFSIYCRIFRESQALYLHNTTLTFQGRLPSPENVHINESVNASTIEWKPPHSSVNNNTVHVDPHITQYTVYTTDNYTGNIVIENVTETHFTFNTSDDDLCLTYRVSAWNVGGEGELSDPVQESTPQVPHRIAAENVTVAYTVKPNVLHIHIDVDIACTIRIPEFFLITLMTPTGGVLKESNITHDPGQAVANFTISVPQSVYVCSLCVKISAGNSAGTSSPSEAIEVDCSDHTTDSPATTSTGSEDNEDLAILIVVAVAGGVMIIALTALILCKMYRKHRRRNSKANTSGQRATSESPSLGGPVPVDKPPVPEPVYVTSEHTTTIPVARDTEDTAIRTHTLESTPSTLRTGSSTESGHSADLLLPPSPPASARSSHLVYAQVDPVKQTEVHLPANDDHVQYAQIEQK